MELAIFFFTLQNNLKMYHWQTNVYARHISSDELFKSIIKLSDKFMETYQGKYKKIDNTGTFEIQCKHFNDEEIVDSLKKATVFLSNLVTYKFLSKEDTELLNIRDDINGRIQNTIYLFTFQ